MKTFVIISDTHRNTKPLDKIATVLAECDYIIHLGDMAGDARELMRAYPEKTYVLAGNNDFFGGESKLVLDAEGRRIFACHGHRYGVKSGTERLVAAAKERLCDIALYGHTHEAEVREENGVLLINPGCMTAYAPHKSYCYLVVNGKKAVPTIVNL
ncbi:MAG TPA: metallophosphoesterase [Candidatus Borkfalkia excrementigallinarum]|uniref:Phosphoesterase n=1 Tax=Candidatus Borkfalkia excrementigallinarum TaxID=2838506 RepID=A0A9D2CR01_9FIRM|nr:metallophosphoesterase [Candidatus Borkfalkia excrementigallinarum]